ncbi:Transcriptional regulator containing PAS, AAA-type ATPase, and DNA-binding Fis domains [Dethiosulfatibacter aminovorans DSM 17477]|uniref:Transcriptional regulator containing PAS, AAA-type ATPase, and DNA-binding Fis domains n=1 Tax=Dethiosulfatibacter aminovorans DSM 17477 TaxID=1121476 RepID=A0A1M6C1S7_9FIRM|nr:sigma 54-interacting transcriptional regulator [Dethiosulfatibacter aminovorans]SHI54781.1 Transcriptional regulator containing PAS, AAA-type ATPase, and DNA-binding Fis domains [Dethiosulfatibacter aminovorans DSM 17477]
MNINNWVKLILDSIYDGVLIIDENAVVQYINPAYTRITTVKYDDIVGKSLKEVRPGARLPNVLHTGEKILRALRLEDGIEYIVNMSPIVEDGQIIGGISLVKGLSDVYELTSQINEYQKDIKKLQNSLKAIQRARYTFSDILAEDPGAVDIKKIAMKIAKKDTTVLMTGESGTGKELYAQAIHNASPRSGGPFVAVNCASLQSSLLESELFGYQEGSFTGAVREGKIGLFEAANGGTIFLDEISEMDFNLQSKLLRTLQENTIRRIGSIKEIPIDVRVITATNKDLDEMVAKKEFREDLYYRIAVFPLQLLPLRDRKGDILPLVHYFTSYHEDKLKRGIDITSGAKNMLLNYDWPGNIRELRNCMEFAVNMMDDFIIDIRHLPRRIQTTISSETDSVEKLDSIIRMTEKRHIGQAIEIFGDSVEGKKKAAEALGISLASLYNKMK